MKVTMSFNLPDEKEEYELANKATDLLYAFNEIKSFIRNELKYNEKLLPVEQQTFQVVYDRFWEIVKENELGGLIE